MITHENSILPLSMKNKKWCKKENQLPSEFSKTEHNADETDKFIEDLSWNHRVISSAYVINTSSATDLWQIVDIAESFLIANLFINFIKLKAESLRNQKSFFFLFFINAPICIMDTSEKNIYRIVLYIKTTNKNV